MYLKAKTYIYVFAKSTLCQLAKIPTQVEKKQLLSHMLPRGHGHMHQPKSFKISSTYIFSTGDMNF